MPVALPNPPCPLPDDLDAQFPTPASAEQFLLRLREQERALLENFGKDHPDVCAVRGRIAVVQAYLQSHPEARTKPPAEPVRQEEPTSPAPGQVINAYYRVAVRPSAESNLRTVHDVPTPTSPEPASAKAPDLQPGSLKKGPTPRLENAWLAFLRWSAVLSDWSERGRVSAPCASSISSASTPGANATGLAEPIARRPRTDDSRQPASSWTHTLVLVTGTLFVHLAALVFLFRRFGGPTIGAPVNHTVVIRTESAPAPAVVQATEPVAEAPATVPSAEPEELVDPAEIMAAAALGVGAVYAEERRRKEEEAEQQQQGILRQIFDDNVRLQEQLLAEPIET
jgi:hypothetical protein